MCGMESERGEDPVGAGRCGERTERCRWQRKRSERVAAVKILSVSRKAAQKFWAPQQGHRPLRKRYKECDAERNPPVTASPCQPPLGKGAMGTGVRIATASVRTSLAMTLVFYGGAVVNGGGLRAARPTDVFSDKKGERRGRSPYCLNRIDQKFLMMSTISAPMRF